LESNRHQKSNRGDESWFQSGRNIKQKSAGCRLRISSRAFKENAEEQELFQIDGRPRTNDLVADLDRKRALNGYQVDQVDETKRRVVLQAVDDLA